MSLQISQAIQHLQTEGYRVTPPLELVEQNACLPTLNPTIKVAILDTETTGLDQTTDRIIELGILVAEVDRCTGKLVQIIDRIDALEDPGIPIPANSTAVNGITNTMVAGHHIDDEQVKGLIEDVELVIAHNAGFDRPFVESRIPAFIEKAWACSLKDIDWHAAGISSGKLEYLAYFFGFHFNAHRALVDCRALLQVLNQTLPGFEHTAMLALLNKARSASVRLIVSGNPFGTKDMLKNRGYRWNSDDVYWARIIPTELLSEETAWLHTSIFAGESKEIETELLDAYNRYSNRPGVRSTLSLGNGLIAQL